MAVFEIVFQLLGLPACDPVLELVDIAGFVALGRHGFGRDVPDVENAARIFEERQGVVGIEQTRFGIRLGLVKVVVGIESVRFLCRSHAESSPQSENDIKQVFIVVSLEFQVQTDIFPQTGITAPVDAVDTHLGIVTVELGESVGIVDVGEHARCG